jgi:hypothetical protein
MANVVSQELRRSLLTAYFNKTLPSDTLFLRLYTSAAGDITETTSLASIAAFEQAGSGYTAKTLSPNTNVPNPDWVIASTASGVRATLANKQWQTDAVTNAVWGDLRYAVITTSSGSQGDILLVRDYGPNKTVTGIGATVTVDNLYYQINDLAV